MNSKVMASCANDRDRVARIFDAYNASAEVASKKLEAVEAKQDFHVGISVVFMKSRKVTAYLQVRLVAFYACALRTTLCVMGEKH